MLFRMINIHFLRMVYGMPEKITNKDITERIFNIENRLDLLDGSSEVSIIWERIRHIVSKQLLIELGLHKSKNKIRPQKQNLLWKIRIGCRLLWNSIVKNPFFVWRKPTYLFWGSPRRKMGNDGYYIDIYTDYFSELLPGGATVTIEKPYEWKHFKPVKTERIKYADFFLLCIFLFKKIYPWKDKIKIDPVIKEIEKEIYNEFGVTIKIQKMARETQLSRIVSLLVYRFFLRMKKPELLLLVGSYGKSNLIEAAKIEGITTIELQHGVYGPLHMGYSFPGELKKKSFPDYLFTFGQYWCDNVSFPAEKEKIFPVGFPHLSLTAKNYNTSNKKDQVVFISQPTTGFNLAQYALSVAEQKDRPKSILFKLHSDEFRWWREEYPDLLRAHEKGIITVVDSDSPALYSLLAESKYQVGVNSTALFEGIAFNCRTVILKITGHEYMSDLVNYDMVLLVDTGTPLDFNRIPRIEESVDYFFNKDWENAFNKAIMKIIKDSS